MSHPLDFIPTASRKKAFFPLLALTLGLLAIFRLLDAPLQNPVSPMGIVSFELAGTTEKADAIIQAWDSRAKLFAAFSLGFDYLFMFAYGLTISLGVLMAASKHGGIFAKVGNYLVWGVLLASLLDAGLVSTWSSQVQAAIQGHAVVERPVQVSDSGLVQPLLH